MEKETEEEREETEEDGRKKERDLLILEHLEVSKSLSMV